MNWQDIRHTLSLAAICVALTACNSSVVIAFKPLKALLLWAFARSFGSSSTKPTTSKRPVSLRRVLIL